MSKNLSYEFDYQDLSGFYSKLNELGVSETYIKFLNSKLVSSMQYLLLFLGFVIILVAAVDGNVINQHISEIRSGLAVFLIIIGITRVLWTVT